MNLDKLKSDIANNEICVLVNGQPETVDFKQWCRDMATYFYNKHGYDLMWHDIKNTIMGIADGAEPEYKIGTDLYSKLDY